MIKILKLSFILSLFFTFLKAEIVNNLKINGNSRISDETIKIYGEIELGKDLSESDLDDILKNLFGTNFFEDVKINLEKNILYIDLVEYPVINQLIIVGEKSNKYKEQIKKIIQLKEKNSFIKSYLSKDIDRIKTLYSSIGYNFSKIETKIKKIDEKNIDLVIEINRGEQTKISSINFLGNQSIRSSRLKDVIASEEDKFWKFISKNTNLSENLIELDKRLLINYYKSLGFYDINIKSNIAELKDTGDAELTYSVEEGKRYTINKISTNVDQVFDKNIFFPLNKSFQKFIGEYYSPFKVKKLLDDIDELIETNNLQFTEHNVQEVIEGNSINIVFNIFEGDKTLVERINITGNNITNEDVIRGELILDEGDPFTKLSLDKSIAEIKSRGIFKEVKSEVVNGSKNNLKIININVEEKPTGEISAGAGIGTNGGSFAFNVQENNWLGQGKEIGLEFEVSSDSVKGNLSFTDPNYDLLGNSIRYSIESDRNDKPDQGYENSIISAGIGTGFEQYKNVFTRLALYATHDDLRTNSSASSSLQKQKGKFSELSGEYSFTLDQRNRKFSPTDGSIVSFGQAFPFVADKPYLANKFTSSSYKTFGENLIGSGKITLESINGLDNEDVRLSKRKLLSSKKLRGFERGKVGPKDGDDHIGGNYAAAINFDAKMPNLLPDSYNADIGFFLDFGNVWGVDYDSSLDESNEIRSSTGMNINWLSPLGPVSFTFATNLAKADTDKTQSFNFNLGTQF